MQLYKHQLDAIRQGILKKKYALYHEQGLGKTFTAIAIAKFAIVKENIKEIYVVCPAFLKSNWEGEILKFQPDLLPCFKMFSYEMFTKLPEIIRESIQFIIVDEAHYIRNRRTLRTNAVVTAAMRSKRVLLLTGTPIGNSSILDLYTHLVCLDCKNKYAKFSQFFNRFVHKTLTPAGFPVNQPKNEGEFLALMEPLSERKTKNECLDLPDKIYVTIPAKGTRVGQGTHIIHKAMAQEGFSFTAENSAQVFQAHENKLSVLGDLLETLENKQVVIYVAFKNSVDLIANYITKKFKKKSLKFLGNMCEKKRIQAIEDFKSGKIQYLVATMQALNTGVTLTNCNNVIYYSRSFSRIERLQSEDRFHRINQLNKVTYYDIIGDGFDKKAYELGLSKKSYDEIKEQLEKFEG